MNNKTVTVLKNLMDGGKVEVSGETWLLDNDNELCIKRGDLLLKVNFGGISLPFFIDWARNIPDDAVIAMVADAALQGYKQDEAKTR